MTVIPFPANAALQAGGTAATPAGSTSRSESAALDKLVAIAHKANHLAASLDLLIDTLDEGDAVLVAWARRAAKRELGEYKQLFEDRRDG